MRRAHPTPSAPTPSWRPGLIHVCAPSNPPGGERGGNEKETACSEGGGTSQKPSRLLRSLLCRRGRLRQLPSKLRGNP
eukprot:829298-Pyramimonas_sp.AAC.1